MLIKVEMSFPIYFGTLKPIIQKIIQKNDVTENYLRSPKTCIGVEAKFKVKVNF